MKLSAPTTPVFLISVVIAALAIAAEFIAIPVVSGNQFWAAIAAYGVLFLGNVLKGV